MAGHAAQMIDPGALAIVLAGTLLATAARCGWTDLMVALTGLRDLGRTTFDEDANRVALAHTVNEIGRHGPLCADIPMPPDASLAKWIDTFIRTGSLTAMHTTRRAERTAREIVRARAARVFEFAGELAPVFGLVGTLFAITQLVPDPGSDVSATMSAIATAVLSTLYGVLTAHLFCIPIARAIERRGDREESAREQLAEWLELQLQDHHSDARQPARIRDVA